MYRFTCKLPHGEIKIPHPCGICFEGEVGAITEVAVRVGEAAASVENLEEKAEELETKTEELEQKIEVQHDNQNWWNQYTDVQISELFNRVAAIESKIEAMEVVEEAANEDPEEEPPAEIEPTETVIEGESENPPASAEEAAEPEPAKKSIRWGAGL